MDDRYSVSPTPAPSEPPSWPSPPPGMKVKALRYYDFREYFGHDHRRLVSMEGNTPCINVRPTVRSKRIVEKLKELWRPKRPAYAFDATNDNNNDNHYKGNNDNNLGVKRFPRQHLFTQPHFDYGFSLKPAGIPWNNYHRNPHYWQQRRLPDCYRPSYPAASPRSDSDVDPSSGSPIYDSSHDDSSSSSPSTPLPPHPYYDREYRFAEYEEEQDEFYCERCELSFASRDSADNHMDEEDHWAPRYGCEMCERKYMSLEAANKHMDTLKHRVPRYSCETCPKQYATRKAAQDHMDLSDHWKPVIRCEPCGIDFSSENALKSHHESHIHWGHKVRCFFCGGRFVSSTGLTHHIESNSCRFAADVDRAMLIHLVRSRDARCIITKPQISWTEESAERRNVIRFDESIYDPSMKQYQCPNNTLCQRDFISLAGLLNHLECGSCGFTNFDEVHRLMMMMEKDEYSLDRWLECVVMFMATCRTRLDG